MPNLDPIYLLITSIFMLVISLVDIFYTEKKEKFTLIVSVILLACTIASYSIYEEKIITNESSLKLYSLFSLIVYIIFLFYFIKIFIFSISKLRQYYLITNSIKNTKWNAYYVVDHKNRIKDMSESFLEHLSLKLEEVKGKNIFDIFDKKIRFLKFNGEEITNKEVKKFYLAYKKNVKVNSIDKRELIIQNSLGEQVILNLVEQPIFYFNKYKGRINVGEIKTDFNMLNIEKELLDTKDELDSIKNKFTSTFEIITTPLLYYDLNEKYIWGNEAFRDLLKLSSNTMLIEELARRIHEDDFKKYNDKIHSLSIENPSFEIKYRVLVDNKYIWIREKIKRIFENKNENMMVSTMEAINNEHYMRTNMPVLDNIASHNELLVDLENLMQLKRQFYVVYFRLSSIPEINEEVSREFGNMAMSEYIKKLKLNFVSDNSNIYRVGGIDFILTITDYRKMELFKRSLISDYDSINLMVEFGAIKSKVKVNIGVATAFKDTDDKKRLIEISKNALKMSLKSNYKKDYCFSEDLY